MLGVRVGSVKKEETKSGKPVNGNGKLKLVCVSEYFSTEEVRNAYKCVAYMPLANTAKYFLRN